MRNRKPTPTGWNRREFRVYGYQAMAPDRRRRGHNHAHPQPPRWEGGVPASPISATRHRCPAQDSSPSSSHGRQERLPSCAHLGATPGGRITPSCGRTDGGTIALQTWKGSAPRRQAGVGRQRQMSFLNRLSTKRQKYPQWEFLVKTMRMDKDPEGGYYREKTNWVRMRASGKGRELAAKMIESEQDSMSSRWTGPFAALTPPPPTTELCRSRRVSQTTGNIH